MKFLKTLSFLVLLFSLSFLDAVRAQDSSASQPYYLVEEGDSLWGIALKFGIPQEELAQANGLTDPGQLVIGAQLILPGFPGVTGELQTREVEFGENLFSLSRKYQHSLALLTQLNRLVSPTQLYHGKNLVLKGESADSQGYTRYTLHENTSILEAAIVNGVNPWVLLQHNQVNSQWDLLPGETLFLLGGDQNGPGGLPAEIQIASLSPSRILQGSTVVLRLDSEENLELSGRLANWPLRFVAEGNSFYALQGVHALTEPGFYPLSIAGNLERGTTFSYTQMVYIGDAGYPFDPVLVVDPASIDPAVTEPENEQMLVITAPVTDKKLWQGQFISPVDALYSDCFPSRFGNRRSYNGSTYDYFHSGLDFCGQPGHNIYAPAAGRVVFSGPLTVRGNTTIIDHGWGIYSVYMHQSEILVETGDLVESGQLIGLVGATGRVTGPHLHWEIWAGGVQVDPIYWLENTFP